MASLFSTFDPHSFMGLPLAWASSLTVLILLPSSFWSSHRQILSFFTKAKTVLVSELTSSFHSKSLKRAVILPVSLLIIILLNNRIGLLPYTFTASTHLSFTLALALPLWLGHVVKAWIYMPQRMLAHLVPLGTPPVLMPFIVIIERVSNLIRPLTLSVRLAANIIAGHLLLSLISGPASAAPSSLVVLIVIRVMLLATLESAVVLIQAYVFSVLSTLYLQEVNSYKLN